MSDDLPTLDPTPNPEPGAKSDGSSGDGFIPPAGSPARMPKQIGKYRIKKLIGTGGMGSVYQAVQEQPRRNVAIKLMKSGVASSSALRRFEYESQLLARLRHPGIAEVYDAGTHEAHDGSVPYFVMEYIAGAKRITDYVRDKKLGTRERLKLFIEVASAVHHGHTKGIIHRDLKPDNIIVDSHGRVKVIDFGVARATDSDLAVTTLQTDIGQLIGTVQYMSPEQVEAEPDDLDTRSDVYALGVMLYEMLCDQLPYDVSKLKIYDATRVVREQEAMKLSTVNTALRGDIETITLKALEKDRDRRYQSAENLAADIQRYLNDEPIMAHPPSVAYQMHIFARRHKPLMAGAAAVFAALLLGVLASTYLWLDAASARDVAQQAEQRANSVTNFLFQDIMSAADPEQQADREITLRQVLDEAQARFGNRFDDAPLVEAAIKHQLGQTYFNLGENDIGSELLGRAYQLRLETLGPEHADTLASMEVIATFQLDDKQMAELLAIRRRTLGDLHPDTLRTRQLQLKLAFDADYLITADKLMLYEKELQGIIQNQQRVLVFDHPDPLDTMSLLVDVYFWQDDFEKNLAMRKQLLERQRTVLGEKHPDTLLSIVYISDTLIRLRRYEEAQSNLEGLLELHIQVLGEDHPQTLLALEQLVSLDIIHERYTAAINRLAQWTSSITNEKRHDRPQLLEMKLGILYAWIDDPDAHHQYCKALLAKHKLSEGFVGPERAAKSFLILPSTDQELLELAEQFTQRVVVEGKDDSAFFWYALVHGMAKYRLGQYSEATHWLQEAQQNEHKLCHPAALTFDAMNEFQLGNHAIATQRLEAAKALIATLEYNHVQWHDVMICQLALKEAQALIEQ